mgnify:CR=1 FL=1
MSNVDERVKKIVVEQLGVKEEEVTNAASFVDDLGADSLDTVELVMALEEEFETEIPDEEAEKIQTVQDAIDYIEGDETIWEHEPVEGMVADGQLMGYQHDGFWSCMDTLREKQMLEKLWATNAAPWRIWDSEK